MGLTKGNLNRQHTVGGYTFDWDPANNPNDICLWAQASDGTTNQYHTARDMNGTAGYQVPVGKTLKIIAVDLNNTAAYASQWSIGYGDTDVGLTSAAAPTNVILHNAGYQSVCVAAVVGTYGGRGGLSFSVPAGKYPLGQSAGSAADRSGIQLYCKLV